jgi:hypothetical protein
LLCSIGWPWTWDPLASASQMLGLQAYFIVSSFQSCIFFQTYFPSSCTTSSFHFEVYIYIWGPAHILLTQLGAVHRTVSQRRATLWDHLLPCWGSWASIIQRKGCLLS